MKKKTIAEFEQEEYNEGQKDEQKSGRIPEEGEAAAKDEAAKEEYVPDFLEGILPRPPGMLLFHLAGKFSQITVFSGRLLVHARFHCCNPEILLFLYQFE